MSPRPESPGAYHGEVQVLPYDPKWPEIYETEISHIQKILGDHVLALHHIGSTSVSGLSAKKDIDILLVIDVLEHALNLQKLGYIFKGELNVPLRYFFSKNTDYSKVNLHVCEAGHGFVELNLTFRNFLRENPDEAKKYEALKLATLKLPEAHKKVLGPLSIYGINKDVFIKSSLKKAGFDELTVNFCIHVSEWSEYHRIKEEQVFKRIGVAYDKNHPSIHADNHYHLCLYKGIDIVAIAHIELLSDNQAALRPFCVDTPYQRQGYGTYLLNFIEKWLRNKHIHKVFVHANVEALDFYKKLGYEFMPFDDYKPGLSSNSKDMGKVLKDT